MYGPLTYGSQIAKAPRSQRAPVPSPSPHHNTAGPQSNAYQSNAIMTASPGKLLLMLYDGAIKFCTLAEEAIEAKNTVDRNANLVKAQDILTELRVTLNYDPNPVFATKMNSLYVFYEKELMLANVENNIKKIAFVKRHLTELRDTWAKVI